MDTSFIIPIVTRTLIISYYSVFVFTRCKLGLSLFIKVIWIQVRLAYFLVYFGKMVNRSYWNSWILILIFEDVIIFKKTFLYKLKGKLSVLKNLYLVCSTFNILTFFVDLFHCIFQVNSVFYFSCFLNLTQLILTYFLFPFFCLYVYLPFFLIFWMNRKPRLYWMKEGIILVK